MPLPPLTARQLATLPFDAALAELARHQHGVVTRAQVRALGLGDPGIDARLRRGALHAVHRGVLAVGHRVLTPDGHRMAAALAVAPGGALTHRSAADLEGWRRSATSYHELTSPRGARSRPGLLVHRAPLAPDELTSIRRIPVTTTARTLLDLADVLSDAALRRAVREADRTGCFDRRAVDAALERHAGRRRAVARLRRAAAPELVREALTSPLEDDFADLLERFCLPFPDDWDVLLHGRERDAVYRAERLVVELDSRTYHAGAAAFEDDRARDAQLLAIGWRTLRFTRRRVLDDAAAVADELRRVLLR